MAVLRYRITKTADSDGVGTYSLTYVLDDSTEALVQKCESILKKEDADGTFREERVEMPVASIVSYKTAQPQAPTTDKINGFAVNVSDANLAIGGVYYEVESTSGTYPYGSSSYPEYVSPWG